MNKAILVLVLLIAAAAIGLPPLIGMSTENIVRTRIEQMNENPVLDMQVSEYDRGWFGSTASVEVALDSNYLALMTAGGTDGPGPGIAEALGEQAITIPMRLAHGPIVLMNGFYLGLARLHAVLDDRNEFAAMVTQELGLDYLAELTGQMSFFGTFSFEGNVPPVEYIDESAQFSFSGFDVEGTARGEDLQLDGLTQTLRVDAPGNTIDVENFRMSSDSTRLNAWFWEGEFTAGVDRVGIVDTLAGADGVVELNGLSVSGNVDVDDAGELAKIAATYRVGSANVPAEEIELTDTELTITLENLSVEPMIEYYELVFGGGMQNPAAAAAMADIGMRVLEHSPSMSLDPIRFTLGGDSLDAAISLRTVNTRQGNIDLSNPMVLPGLFEASAELTAAKPLIERLARQAAAAQLGMVDPADLPPGQDLEAMAEAQANLFIIQFVGQGYLIEDGDNYSTAIEYANGDLRINGMPLPLGAMLQ